MNKKFIPYKKVKEYVKNLNEQITISKWNPDLILSVNRGGCVPGIYLSHLRDVKHEVICLNKKDDRNNSIYLNKIIDKHLSVLVVDDINDTGNTLADISNIYKNYINKFKFAVIIDNNASSFNVNYYNKKIDKTVDNSWIVFPWESIDSE
ncbi:MAG: phosphoribosyltransferase family protein [Cytophagales bacterium]|nr:phosphoribosyltransferase family protein [Cytophagales bacterium]